MAVHMPEGSAVPAATAVQVPAVPLGGLQVSQTPLHAVSQQTPSRVLQVRPAMHWEVVVHVPPFGSSPHEPPTQVAGAVHWVSLLHTLVQALAVASQRPGAHEVGVGVTQVPAPSHLAAGFWVLAVGQLAPAHWLPAANFAHCPATQDPVVPQLEAGRTGHRPFGSGPEATLAQVPWDPFRLQAWQAPVQVELQQNPDTQCPCRHCVSAEQEAPSFDSPHELPTHELGGEMHCTLVRQVVKHLVPLQR